MSRILRLLSIGSLVLVLGVSYALAETAAATPAAAPAETITEATPSAPVLSDAEKAAALAAADAITVYDASKVVGMATPWQYTFQPAESPNAKEIKKVHDFIFIIISVIVVVVLGLLLYVILRFNAKANPKPRKFSHNTLVEIVWTAVPILILVAIGIPSVRAHYAFIHNKDIIDNPDVTLKVVGHQWYWSYEYPDAGISFDSNLKKKEALAQGEPFLLAVDNPIVVPVNKVVRLQITAADVIHAFALPALGVRTDAMPGRLNETWFKAEREGIYYGQCSELCGKYHGFMPIQLHVVSQEAYDAWIAGAKLKFAAADYIQLAATY